MAREDSRYTRSAERLDGAFKGANAIRKELSLEVSSRVYQPRPTVPTRARCVRFTIMMNRAQLIKVRRTS